MEQSEVLDIHMTALFTWLVRTIGQALLWSLVAAGALGIVAAVRGEVGWIWLASFLAPLVFAIGLASAQAPMPVEVNDELDV